MRRLLGVLVLVAAVALLGWSTWSRVRAREAAEGGGAAANPAAATAGGERREPGMAIPVEGDTVRRGTMTLAVTAAGQAEANRRTRLLALVDGRVAELPVTENAAVSAGQLVLAIDTEDYRLALERARLGLEQREAEYRELTLFDDRITDPALRAERDRAARIRSRVDEARLDVQKAELDLRRARVTAPFAGVIADLKVVPGQMVRAGDEIATVVHLDPIHVEVQVLEGDVGALRVGGRGRVTFAAMPDEPVEGAVRTINPVVDGTTRTARVTLAVPNPGRRILPGMYARVSLDSRAFADRLMVPRAAILERDRDRRKMLFVVEDGTAQWKYVATGLENDRDVEIVPTDSTDAVEPGQVVLVRGHHTLTHGAPVRVVADAPAAGGRPR